MKYFSRNYIKILKIKKQFIIQLWLFWLFQEAILDQLPETVGTILQEAIDATLEATNSTNMNYIFSNKGMNFLSVISLPYVVPAKVIYGAFNK